MQKKILLTACLCFLAGLLGGFFLSRTGTPRAPEGAAFNTPNDQPPADDAAGINLRADFNPQSALIIGANEMVRYHQRTFIEMIQAIGPRTPVIALVNDRDEYNTARELLNRAGVNATNVFYMGIELNSMWVRDYGPIFVSRINQIPYIIDFDYSNVDEDKERWRDNDFPIMFGNIAGLEVRHTPLRLEGGNLLSNGDGLCLTTTALIGRNISRGYSKEQIGVQLRNAFGFDSWVYLQTLEGEATGHVDMFVTFLRRNLALVAKMDPATDPENAALLDEAAALISQQMTSLGRIRVHRIPMPSPKEGNFYFRVDRGLP